jgi:hypothetical protein
MKDIFPHRYRRIAAKCLRESPSGRYASVEALERAFRRRGQALRYGALGLAAALMAAAFVWMGSRQRQAEAKRSEVRSNFAPIRSAVP